MSMHDLFYGTWGQTEVNWDRSVLRGQN
jgi:hypothetical protein